MVSVWNGNLDIGQSQHLSSLIFTADDDVESANIVSASAQFSFLAFVDICRIPLPAFLGPHYSVTTTHPETECWLQDFALNAKAADTDPTSRHELDGSEPEIGILFSVEDTSTKITKPLPRITEILLYAARSRHDEATPLATPPPASSVGASPNAATLQLLAVGISSDLLHPSQVSTPPPSPRVVPQDHIDAVFLSIRPQPQDEVVHEPLTRKRKSITDTFNEAAQRRQRARHGGGLVSGNARDSQADDTRITLKQHRRSVSNMSGPLRPRSSSATQLPRSPTLSASQAPFHAAHTYGDAQKRSSLSQVQNVTEAGKHVISAADVANKEFISRIVMAGMRFHGLTQAKSRHKQQAASAAGHSLPDLTVTELDAVARQDEEFKLVYHQVFKGTIFAFRHHISNVALQSRTETLRDTVDRLLAIFCGDPLASGLADIEDKLTPGGRKAFGSASASATPHRANLSATMKMENT